VQVRAFGEDALLRAGGDSLARTVFIAPRSALARKLSPSR
jgi:hypothetical protein